MNKIMDVASFVFCAIILLLACFRLVLCDAKENQPIDPYYKELYQGIVECRLQNWSPYYTVEATEEVWGIRWPPQVVPLPDGRYTVVAKRGRLSCYWIRVSAVTYAEGALEVLVKRQEKQK